MACKPIKTQKLGDSRKYPSIPQTASQNSEGKAGIFELEFRRHGGILTSGILKAWLDFRSGISREYRQVILWAFLFLLREQASMNVVNTPLHISGIKS